MHPQVFSFKIRGAYNLMANLNEDERWRGVVTCSAGEFLVLRDLCLG
jgi:threonine dehydratase